MQPRTTAKSGWFHVGRIWDVLALCIIALVVWKWFFSAHNSANTGYPAPALTYASLEGKPISLPAQRGHVVFLDFWATWCEPCKIELPLVQRFAREHPEAVVIPVNVGEALPAVRMYAREHHLGNVGLDPAARSQGYFQIEGFPTLVVIDPRGRIRATWQGFNPAITTDMSNALRVFASKNS